MKQTRLLMGMPIALEVVDLDKSDAQLTHAIDAVFDYFVKVDERFSTYKDTSEISRINRGEVALLNISPHMQEVFKLAEKTKQESKGYFDLKQPTGIIDPSGVVKGWAIQNAAELLQKMGVKNFYIDAGGDIQTGGTNAKGGEWSIGIRNPFKQDEIIKVLYPRGQGVATSGTYVRGQHIYNPHQPNAALTKMVSLTVVGPNVLEADRFATAAFAMGEGGIHFIESLAGFEGYAIDSTGVAILTTGFESYTQS